jgi:hypothetical protein
VLGCGTAPERGRTTLPSSSSTFKKRLRELCAQRIDASESDKAHWSDLDYERQMIHLRRVWVGNELVPRMKSDGSAAPVTLGDLLVSGS